MNKSLLEEADNLIKNEEYLKALKLLLPYKNKKNDEILWRLAQAMHDLTYYKPHQCAKNIKLMNEEALQLATKALEINERNPEVHKIMVAVIDNYYKNISIKARVQQCVVAKNHAMRALELNPKDPQIWFLLGNWHYTIADLPWAVKKMSQHVFSTPLESSYEEACTNFQKVLDLQEPKTYRHCGMAFLMAGKCFAKLNKPTEAAQYWQRVFECPQKTEIAEKARKEAAKLLRNYRAKNV